MTATAVDTDANWTLSSILVLALSGLNLRYCCFMSQVISLRSLLLLSRLRHCG